MLDFASAAPIAEGKTKVIYANPDDPRTVYMLFKDDITAGDGLKHDIIEGKAVLDWQVNRDIYTYLNRCGIPTHYIDSPAEKIALVRKLDRKINLEVVSRRVAAGSILKWGSVVEGARFDPPITQFHYKDDPLHDPMLDEAYIDYLVQAKGAEEYKAMRQINPSVLLTLEKAFARFGLQLVDLKLEYGIIDGQVCVIDEISGGSLRLWPYRTATPRLEQPNVLGELDPEGRLDKDTYRMGDQLDKVMSRFASIANITKQFADLP
jgi:phosphoribosylaminoimidazole-succinocarboxamide synthase